MVRLQRIILPYENVLFMNILQLILTISILTLLGL